MTVLVLFGGCVPGTKEPIEICAGAGALDEAIVVLKSQHENIRPIRAGGNCRITWFDEKGKSCDENTTINVRFFPPGNLYMKGDILGGEVFLVGSNEDEFWLRLKPKEITSYWWGRRELVKKCPQRMPLDPCVVNEAFGAVEVDATWDLINRDGFDILTMRDSAGMPIKRVHIYCCDYRVAKIEYYNRVGFAAIVMELADYIDGGDGITVPAKIIASSYDYDRLTSKVEMNLKNIRLFEPTKEQLEGKLFKRALSDGCENIYELGEDCSFVKQ